MTADASPKKPPAPNKDESRHDEGFKQSMAELSRRLGERVARQSTVDAAAAAEARRAALQAYDQARLRRLTVAMGLAVAAFAGGGGIAYLVADDVPPAPSANATAANAAVQPEPASPVSLASAAAVPAAPEPPPAASNVAATPSVPAAAAMDSRSAPVAPLQRDEVSEIQARLRSFGFNPGPVDGVSGPMTQAAVVAYQQARAQPQTAALDRDLLEQLRQDPAPPIAQRQVAQHSPRPASGGAPAGRRRSDPFEPMRAAGDRLGHWLESMLR